jgi:hypothetical protein
MKTYRIGLCYSDYVWQEVKAANEDEAYNKAAEITENAYYAR